MIKILNTLKNTLQLIRNNLCIGALVRTMFAKLILNHGEAHTSLKKNDLVEHT